MDVRGGYLHLRWTSEMGLVSQVDILDGGYTTIQGLELLSVQPIVGQLQHAMGPCESGSRTPLVVMFHTLDKISLSKGVYC